MADLASVVTVLDRAATTTLLVIDEAPFQLVAVEVGGRSYRRTVVTSPFVHGNQQTTAVADVSEVDVAVRITETTSARAEARLEALLGVLSADDLVLVWQLGDVIRSWAAYAPDVVQSSEAYLLRANQREVNLTFPTQPYPTLAGLPAL